MSRPSYYDDDGWTTSTGTPIKTAKRKKKVEPLDDLYIPSDALDDSEILNLDDAFESVSNMLDEEGMTELSDEIAHKINDLNNMFSNGELKTILLNVVHELVKSGKNDLLLIKHDSARDFYEKYSDIVKDLQTGYKNCVERKQIRENALKKLSAKEREVLGLG